MRIVSGFLILFCLLFILPARAFDPTYSNFFIHAECKKFLDNKCTNMPDGMKRSLEACAINQKAHGCDEIAAKNPDIKDLIVNCNAKEFCEQQMYDGTDEALSCWNGVKGSVVDTASAIGSIFSNAWDRIKSDYSKRKAFVETCDKSIACKRELSKDFIYQSKLSDKELDKYSADQLLRMVESDEYARKYYGYGNSSATGKNPAPTRTPVDPEAGLKKMRDLWNMASNLAAEKYHRYNCYTHQGKEELKCYIFASLVDPTVVVGKGAKLVKARRLLEAIEKEKEVATLASREATVTAKVLSKSEFTQKYLHYSPTTKEQNLEWMALAENTPKNTKYFDVENSVMKNLNDTMKDKNLVTSLTNYHKELLQTKTDKLVAELKATYPDLEVAVYSDFKASRFAFKGQAPPDLQQRLNKILKETNQEFSDSVTKSGFVQASDHPENWFRAGYGETADQASLAARFSRQNADNTLQSYMASDMKSTMTMKVRAVESARSQLQSELGHTALMEGSGKKILSSDAIDILKKNGSDVAKSQADLKNRFGLSELSETSVRKMQSYVKSVDEFSPSIHIAQREVSHLDEAAFGGLSADMTGMGSKNLNATAKALSDSKTLDEALVQTRKSEKTITEKFNQQKETFQNVLKDVVGKDRIKTVCSGDDCTAIPKQVLSETEKERILQKLTDAGYSSEFRLAFIPENVADTTARSQLAVHGESIEKALRKNLADKMEPAKLKGVVFGVDMKTNKLNQGSVKLITATSSQVRLTASEEKLIAENFQKALEQVNKDLKNGTYRPW